MRAQTSAEWAFILGVVLTAALLVLATSSLLPAGVGGRVQVQDSVAYWGSQARPLEVAGWQMEATGANLTGANLTLVFANAGTEQVRIRKIMLAPGSFTQVYNASGTSLGTADALDILLLPSDRLTLVLRQQAGAAGAYAVPPLYTLNLTITYDGTFPSMVESGRVPLAGEAKVIDQAEGIPCRTNGDCASGYCHDTGGGKICVECIANGQCSCPPPKNATCVSYACQCT
ncbi:Uncharacterised protein [uncultured archaeon]|nr:Uncharacterised protein [uncultured archaeon]